MKKSYFILLFSIGFNIILNAQWVQETSGTSYQLYSVNFPAKDTGYVVGEHGTILKTTNGGIDWTSQTSGSIIDLYSVYFTDTYNGYIAGAGVILNTTNGGANWSITNGGGRSVYFPDKNTGYIVAGNSIPNYKTTNAGNSWATQSNGWNGNSLYSVYFTDTITGFEVGAGAILKTTNGGVDWIQQASGNTFQSVYFINKDTGFVVGQLDPILKTTNGGASWVQQPSGQNGMVLYAVYFTNVDNGYAVGGDPIYSNTGIILQTINGGTNWISQSYPTNKILYSVYFTSQDTGYAVGANGTILKTINGGTVGIHENNTDKSIKIFPNPTTGLFQLSTINNNISNVKIYNVRGQRIYSEDCNHQLTIDISSQPKGIYYLKVYLQDAVITRKIAIQ